MRFLVKPPTLLALFLLTACAGTTTTTTTSPTTTAASTTTAVPITTTTVPRSIVLEVSWPIEGFISTEPVISVIGVTSSGATVTVNGAEASISGDDQSAIFDLFIALTEGDNEIVVAATAGDSGSAEVVVNVRYLPNADLEFAFMERVSVEKIVADYAQFLTGQEAIDAAVEDGVTTPEEGVPNDYYIRNVNPQLRTLALLADVVVILATPAPGAVGEVLVPIDEWLSLFHDDGTPYDLNKEDPPPVEEPHSGFFGAGWGAPYWLTIDRDQVIQIRQQYLP